MPHEFVHGTTYYHHANPPEELAENFRKMREMGLDTVRVAEIWPGWEVLELRPGEFDFASLDDYVAKATAAGLQIIMGIGINNPPFWLFNEFDDLRTVNVNGKIAARRIHAANHDHPGFRARMERFIEAQVRHYAAVQEIIAWQIGNEVRYEADIPDNAATHERFREFLKRQYEANLHTINQRWSVGYRSWEEIFPYKSRFGPPTEGLSPLAIQTRKFKAWSLAELIEWGTQIIRRHSKLPVFHNNHSIPGDTYSHWDIARSGDLVVQDIYSMANPNPQAENTLYLDFSTSISRSLGKPFWVGETCPGQYGTFHRTRPTPEQIETLVIEMLGAGTKGLLYFRHKPPKFEQPHKFTGSQTVLRRDGSEMPYIRTPRHISELMRRHGQRILEAAPEPPVVAAYYPEESLQFSRDAGYFDLQRNAIFGTSAIWNRAGIPIHWLNTTQLLAEPLEQFKLIYLPLSYLLPQRVGERLARYVAAGGSLISECRPGYVDDDGWLYESQPGAGLHEVFGVRQDVFFDADKFELSLDAGGKANQFSAIGPCQLFRNDSAQSIGTNSAGEILAVRNGNATILGFAPSLLFPAGSGKSAINCLTALAGVVKPMPIETDSINISYRYLRSSTERLAFLCNHGDAASVRVPAEAVVITRNIGSELSFDPVPSEFELGRWSWAMISIPSHPLKMS